MKNINNLYKKILPVFVFCACFIFSRAQEPEQDSVVVVSKQDVPVTIAYGAQPGWMVTGAISTTSGSDLQKSFNTNLANALYGRLPGLTVRQWGAEPGADSPGLNARGLNTFGSGSGLLILVDGIESSFEQLTPDEVESIVLLKDASATALYGSRGANGVLLVTTKRGKEGPLVVNFSMRQGFQTPLKLPDFLGSYDYARLYNEALINDGEPARYSEEDLAAYKSGSDPFFHPDVNWYDELLRKSAPSSNYNLNFAGGSKAVRYFVLLNALNSGGFYKKTGNISENSKNSGYSRYNLRSNIDLRLSERLSATFNLAGIIESKVNPGASYTSPVFDKMATIPPNAFPVYNPNGTFGGTALYSNPLGDVLETGYYTTNGRALQLNLTLTEQLDMITRGLSLSGKVAFNTFSQSNSNKIREYERFSVAKNQAGDTIYTKFGQNTSLAGQETHSGQWENYAIQAFLNYSRVFADHAVDAVLMFNSDAYTEVGYDPSFKHIGAGGRLTYANREKYIGEFSFGYYGSENFPKNKRFGFFPAGSIGWILSKENFLRGSDFFSYLKVRGSYGIVGNDQIGGRRFMFDPYYSYTTGYNLGADNRGVNGIGEGNSINPNVTWEKEKKLNVGIEATLLNSIDVTFDYFNQDRYDILAKPYRDVPAYVGVALPDFNVGKVSNKGFEAIVGYHGGNPENLQYSVEASVWYAKNKIVYNSEAFQVNEYLYRTGHPVGQPFVLEAIGFFKDDADIAASPKQTFTTVQPGDIRYKDQNGDNLIDQNDFYPVGKPDLPELSAGLRAGLNYKGFDLDILFQGVTGRTVYLGGNYFWAFQNDARISSFALGRWTPDTRETATYPRLSAKNNLNNFQPSSFWQHDGSYIKLRSVELGYTLRKKATDAIGIDQARVFVNGLNLFSLDHINFTDPEVLTGYPAFRTFSLGIKIQL